MRTLMDDEIDQVGGGLDEITIAGITVTGIGAGLALQNVGGAVAVSFGVGYGIGSAVNAGYTAVSGNTLGTDLYNAKQTWS